MIPFKMMYNMSMLRHRFSNERWGGGGALNHLRLVLFCKSVYCISLEPFENGSRYGFRNTLNFQVFIEE